MYNARRAVLSLCLLAIFDSASAAEFNGQRNYNDTTQINEQYAELSQEDKDNLMFCRSGPDDFTNNLCAVDLYYKHLHTGEWNAQTERSDMYDFDNVYLTTSSLEPFVSMSDKIILFSTLVLKCHEGEPAIHFNFPSQYLEQLARPRIAVTYRIDKKPAESRIMHLAYSRDTIGLWGAEAVPLIKALEQSRSLIIQSDKTNGFPSVQFKFDLRQLSTLKNKLNKACKIIAHNE